MRMLRNAYRNVKISGIISPICAIARTESSSPMPMIATSRSSHSHRVAFAVRLSG